MASVVLRPVGGMAYLVMAYIVIARVVLRPVGGRVPPKSGSAVQRAPGSAEHAGGLAHRRADTRHTPFILLWINDAGHRSYHCGRTRATHRSYYCRLTMLGTVHIIVADTRHAPSILLWINDAGHRSYYCGGHAPHTVASLLVLSAGASIPARWSPIWRAARAR